MAILMAIRLGHSTLPTKHLRAHVKNSTIMQWRYQEENLEMYFPGRMSPPQEVVLIVILIVILIGNLNRRGL